MRRIRFCIAYSLVGAAIVSGCSGSTPRFVAKPAPMLERDEQICLAGGYVRESAFVTTRSSLGGPSACGAIRPFIVSAGLGGRIAFKPSATLRCPMIPTTDKWLANVVVPAAERHFGTPVVELKVAASYACRPINHVAGGRLSEHGRANALDVSAFKLADGRWISVQTGWKSYGADSAFLRDVHRGACRYFSTVLGPNADWHHRNHFHFDLARHGRTGTHTVCR